MHIDQKVHKTKKKTKKQKYRRKRERLYLNLKTRK